MNKYFNQRTRDLVPYVPGEQPKNDRLIKLNTNENPYPPSPAVNEAIKSSMDSLTRYPKPECESLRDTIAQVEGLPSRDYVYMGNGSDEVLAFCFQAYFHTDRPILFPDITYSFYPVYCQLYGLTAQTVPLNDSFNICIDDYNQDNGGIILPNPNAPTGVLLGLDAIKDLLNQHPDTVVVIDEAYIDFGGQTCVPLITAYPNLVVTRTLSKSHGLAGLRVGYAMAQPALLEGIIRVKNSFNSYTMDTLAQAGANAAIADTTYKNTMCQKVVTTRENAKQMLQSMGFIMTDSQSNFLFVRHPSHDASSLMQQLKDQNILVRHFSEPERIRQYLRISIGNDTDMNHVLETLQRIVGS